MDNNNINEGEKKKIEVNPALKFQSDLQSIMKMQESIIQVTQTAKENFHYSNEVCKEQLKTYKENITKYGKYLSMIKGELELISQTLVKIKQLKKQKE